MPVNDALVYLHPLGHPRVCHALAAIFHVILPLFTAVVIERSAVADQPTGTPHLMRVNEGDVRAGKGGCEER
jgi:hypothetical protein